MPYVFNPFTGNFDYTGLDGNLTATRIPYASNSSTLIDSANFTFDGSSLYLSGAQTINSNVTVTLSAPTSLTGAFANIGSGAYVGDGSTVTLSIYAYKTVGIYTTYSSAASVVLGNDNYDAFDITASWNAVTGATGYKIQINGVGGDNGYTYWYTTNLISLTLNNTQTASDSTITPISPQTVPIDALIIDGIVNLDDADFDGKLRLYDSTTNAVVIGNTTGNARGANAIDISTQRTTTSYIASGTSSILLGNGIASGVSSTSIAGGIATGNSSFALVGATSSGQLSIGMGLASVASGYSSLAIGAGAAASGSVSLALLGNATNSGAVAIGQSSTASGDASFALGFFAEASGSGTVSLGAGVKSSGASSLNFGRYFEDNTANAINFGIGSSSVLGGNSTCFRITATKVNSFLDTVITGGLGSESVVNGGFSSSSNWSLGTGWTITAGTARATNITTGKLQQNSSILLFPITAGITYQLTYTVSNHTLGSVRAVVGGVNLTTRSGDGTYTEQFTAVSSNTNLVFEGVTTPATFRLDNISLKRLIAGSLQVGFDASNYFTATGSTTGQITFDAVGSSAKFIFSDAVDIQSSLQADSIVNDTGLAHGTYTPTLTNVTNVAASTARLATYMRVGNTVTVGGQLDIDPTITASATVLGISLPIASNFSTSYQAGGVAFATGITGMGGGIEADATNDRVSLKFIASDVTNQTMTYSFTYEVI